MPMDELLSRQVPQSLEAEQSVLGSMLIDERCVPDVIALLQPDEFYLQQNRDIFETIYTMFNFSQHIDPVTVLYKMKERGVYDEAHSYDYRSQLLQITPTAANGLEKVACAPTQTQQDDDTGLLTAVLAANPEEKALERAGVILETARLGLLEIEKQYPDFVRVHSQRRR